MDDCYKNMGENVESYFDVMDAAQLAEILQHNADKAIIIDSRSFLEFNIAHVSNAINMCCSKIMKRRLQQDKLSAREFLQKAGCTTDVNITIVYDHRTADVSNLGPDSFLSILMLKLSDVFNQVKFLQGGFENFYKNYPFLCEEKARTCPPVSISHPCLSLNTNGPTRILPFLYLGSQYDALNREMLMSYNITYELNVSASCPRAEFIPEGHFMRIPVNDNSSEKLYPHFPAAFQFIDTVRKVNGCVLIHCLAGISRSPAVAIAYIMRYLKLRSDDAYRYVKSKRATISPNFNFLGQLLEYEHRLHAEHILEDQPSSNFKNRNNKNTQHSSWNKSSVRESEGASQNCVKDCPRKMTPLDINHSEEISLVKESNMEKENLPETPSSAKPLRFRWKKSNSAYELGYECNIVDEPVQPSGSFNTNNNLNTIEGIPLSSVNNINSTPCQVSYGDNVVHQSMEWTNCAPLEPSHLRKFGLYTTNTNHPNVSQCGDPGNSNKFNNTLQRKTHHIKDILPAQRLIHSSINLMANALEKCLTKNYQIDDKENDSGQSTSTAIDVLQTSEVVQPLNGSPLSDISICKRGLLAHQLRNARCQIDKLRRANSCPVIVRFRRCSSLESFPLLGTLSNGGIQETLPERPKSSQVRKKNSRRKCYSCGNLQHVTQLSKMKSESESYFNFLMEGSSQNFVTEASKTFASNLGAIKVS